MRSLLLATLTSAALLAGCEGCSKGGGAGGSDAADDASAPESAGRGGLVPVEGGAVARLDGGTLNATPVPTASVAAMVNPDKLPAYTGPTGSIEGTITVTGDPAPVVSADFSRCPDAEKTYGRAFREGPAGAGGARPLADAIVVVTGYKGFYLPETKEAQEVRIEGCAYTTRTLTMTYGERIEVKNLSSDFWTPVLEPGTNLVLMMATPHGDATRIYPKKPGHYLLVDRDRKYASVDVYAFLHPLQTASAPSGYYRIDGVPVGKLKVGTTHPRVLDATAEADVTVSAGVVHKVDLVLKNVNRDAGAPPTVDAGAAGPLR